MNTLAVNPRTKEGRIAKAKMTAAEYAIKYGPRHNKTINAYLAYYNLVDSLKK